MSKTKRASFRICSVLLVFAMLATFFQTVPSYAAQEDQEISTVTIDATNNPYAGADGATNGGWNNKDSSQFPFLTISDNSGWYSDSWEWMYNNANDENSGQYVDFTFTGTAVSLYMAKFDHVGKVKIYIDGTEDSEVDGYDPDVNEAGRSAIKVYEKSGLTEDEHTLRVEVAGRNAAITDWAVAAIRGFEYVPCETTPGLMLVNSDNNPYINNDGGTKGYWTNKKGGQFPYLSFSYSSGWYSEEWEWMYNSVNEGNIGQYVDFIFTGSYISLYMAKFDHAGKINVYIDGIKASEIDGYDSAVNEAGRSSVKVFERTDLTAEKHTLRVEMAGKNEAITDWAVVALRGFECYGVATIGDEWEPGLKVTSMPYKKNYTIGGSLNLSGLEVTYFDGENEPAPIEVTSDMVSGFDSETAGTKTVIITYNSYSTSFDVKVTDKLIMVSSPEYYSSITDNQITVEFNAPGLTKAKATSLHAPDSTNDNPYGYMKTVAEELVLDQNNNGKGTFTFNAADFPKGPIAIRITAWNDNGASDDCYLHLFNNTGTEWDGGPGNTINMTPAAIDGMGMATVFLDEFDEMPSISYTGNGEAKYAAAKPDPYGWPEYSSSKFAPPNYSYGDVVDNYTPFTIEDSQYMKIETKDWGTVIEPNWGQTYTTGFLASMGQDGSGFVTEPGAAQYFETRLFLPPNPGVWPAFWTLTPYDPDGRPGFDEVDVVEAYMGGNATEFTQGHHTHQSDGNTEYGGIHTGGSASTDDFGNKINLTEGWHTYGALITEDMTYFYFDDQYIEGSAVPTQDRRWTVGNYFMVNGAFRDTDAEKFPGGFQRYGNTAEMYVDWVRVFQVQNNGFTPMFTKTQVTPGKTISLDILRAEDVKDLSGTYTVDMPEGWSVVSGGTFAADSKKDTIVLSIPDNFSEFQGEIIITPIAGDSSYDVISINYTTLGLYRTEVYPSLNATGSGYELNLKFTNKSGGSCNNIIVTAQGPNSLSMTKNIPTVEAGGSAVVSFPLCTVDLYNTSVYTLNVQLSEDYAFSLERPVNVLEALKAKTPITIDGNNHPSDWIGAATIELDKQSQTAGTWNGTEDLSAQANVKWDEQYLYLNVEVKDDIHMMQEGIIADAWKGDSLQISLDPARSSGIVGGGPHLSYIAALKSSTGEYGLAVDRCDYAELNQTWSQLLTQSKCVVRRDETSKTTTYALAFAWTEILPEAYTNARNLGLALVINDNDGSGRKGWIKYMDGIATGKEPLLFGDLILSSRTGEVEVITETTPISASISTPVPKVILGSQNRTIVSVQLKGTKDSATGEAMVLVNSALMKSIIDLAKEAETLGKKAIVEIKAELPAGSESVKVKLPSNDLNQLAELTEAALTIDAGIASITFDSRTVDTINQKTESGEISINIKKVDTATLSDNVFAKVGNRPVYDFNITTGDKIISEFGGGKAVVSIPYSPKTDEKYNSIVAYYIDSTGELQNMKGQYNESTGTVDFTVTHFSQYAVGYNEVKFLDVAEKEWFSEAIGFMAARGIVNGVGGEKFAPSGSITRADFVIMALKAFGIAPDQTITDNFVDAGNKYYTSYLATARQLELIIGTGDNRFEPEVCISRQDMLTILYHMLLTLDQLPTGTSEKQMDLFEDAGSIAGYAKDAIRLFVETGIIMGDGINLNPNGKLTRAEAAQIFYNLLVK